MTKTLTTAALVGAIALASMPVLSSSAFAQAAGGPEPMQGAQPMDNAGGGGSMEKSGGAMQKKSMKKGSMKKMKHKKSM